MFDGYPARETAPYGIAKRNVWSIGAAYREQYGMNVVHLIPTNLYGPHDHFEEERSGVVAALIRRLIEAREHKAPRVVVWGDGSATREFIYVADAARGVVEAHERYDGAEPVNLGTGRAVSIKELAETIREIVGYRGEIAWDATRPTGTRRRCFDVVRARERFGFVATVGLAEGLKATVDWYERDARIGPG
jgi:GDP-L-fucose synthase